MKETMFQKIHNVVCGCLRLLKKNSGDSHKSTRETYLEWKKQFRGAAAEAAAHVLAVLALLQVLLSPTALKKYAAWIRQHLTRESLLRGCKAAACWLRTLPGKFTAENIRLCAQRIRNVKLDLPRVRKNAAALAVVLVALWLMLGSSAAVAWLTYTTPADRNSFTVGDMDLVVEYKNKDMEDYAAVDKDTPVFDDEALYEPGYTQVVYFRITNAGNVDFDYQFQVNNFESHDSVNVYGDRLHLPKYLCFGLISAESEIQLDRELAQYYADKDMLPYYDLGEYSELHKDITEGEVTYAALIVYMPEEVDNRANYRGEEAPWVKLGVTVYAQQAGTMEQ